MEAALPASVSDVLKPIDQFQGDGHRQWLDLCYNFLAWERRAMSVPEDASQDDRAAHRKALIYLLKVTEVLSAIGPKDPNLDALRWRLNESWELLCNRPPADEQARLKSEVLAAFPG